MKSRLQAMVDSGVITQEQADQRLESMQEKMENWKPKNRFDKRFYKGFK